MDTSPRPFQINVEESVLDDLKSRLEKTKPSCGAEFNTRSIHYGQEQSLQDSLLNHWRTTYDWRSHEKVLNSFQNFKLKVRGLDVHFIHERSQVPGAVPLILVHGWPGSIYEFHSVIPLLVHPTGRALRLKQAFHVIVPSLPGFGWSEQSKEPGMNGEKISEMFNELMTKLGYDKYVVQGGGFGAIITKYMASKFPNNCVQLHSTTAIPSLQFNLRNFAAFSQSLVDLSPLGRLTLTEREKLQIEQGTIALKSGSAFAFLQASKPHTIGHALSDSPAGLLSWITEKLQLWTDGRGNVLNALSKDDLITNVMIYWVTNSVTSSLRLYFECFPFGKQYPDQVDVKDPGFIEVPTGIASFPRDIFSLPRRWSAFHYNIVHYTEFEEGGHFAAWEQPDLFVQDLRTFVFRSMPFEKACEIAKEREQRRKAKPKDNRDLASNLLLFAPALPVPAIAAIATYLLASKL